MIKIYYSPRTRAVRPRWLLEEMEISYELIRVNLAELPPDSDYLKIHPHGAVPALQDGQLTLIESGAICLYLTEKYPEKGLAPALGSALRPLFLQWMFYGPGTFEAPFSQLFLQTRGLPETERSPILAEKARVDFMDCVQFIEKSLENKEFLLGDQFSAADVMLGMSLLNAKRYQMLQNVPNLDRYLSALEARPARQRAIQD